ncbi:FAD-dependent oxidoreductase [Rhizobium sp. S152]|uniref:FAD-dependent oxidoreductase n=1 Tax=Rhizobium sp. S152 TaxID=3055038 RepID=UPI0025A98C02|nr:FAD-dependent oxidoreductase [Rhizobium sp. S152]MDM9625414.1 FAD-dependent oxidoreductase [Rhizobium sp. S152]
MFTELAGLPENWGQICIVGAGPVGLSLAISLARQGTRVIILESGRQWRTTRAQALSALAHFDPEYHGHSEQTVVRAVGGASLRWGGRCVELDDIDFARRDHVPEASWPIGHEELRRYYEPARHMLTADLEPNDRAAATGAANSLETWARLRNTARAHRLSLRDMCNIAIIRDCTVTDLKVDPEHAAITALECMVHGTRHVVEAPAFVLAAGGRENARLLMETQLSHQRMFGGTDGPLGRNYMGHLTGQIATVSFTTAQAAERYFFKLSRTGTVFRNRLQPSDATQQRLALANIVFWPDSPRPDEVIPGNGAGSLLHLLRHAIADIRHPTRRHSLSAKGVMADHLRNAVANPWRTLAEGSRMAWRKAMPGDAPQSRLISPTNTYLLRYHAEQLPNARSRVTLSDRRDENGCRRLDVDFRYRGEDFTSVVRAHEAMDARLRRNGEGRLSMLKPRESLEDWINTQALDGYHQIGLTPMSATARTGIVDKDCRVHDLRNLFVAGSSIFPTSGQANPTLPAVAFALRLADHLAASFT